MRRTAIFLMLIALMATACGGSDDAQTAADEAPVDAAELADQITDDVVDVVDEALSEVPGAADAAADAADADAGAAAGVINTEACTAAAEALSAVPQSIATALTGQVDIAEVDAQVQALADLDVPEQYAADFQVIADAYAEVASTLDGITLEPGAIPDADTQAELTELSTALSDSGYVAASTNLSGYFAGGCQ